jgi:predicted acylesterase/phospholipase RssA
MRPEGFGVMPPRVLHRSLHVLAACAALAIAACSSPLREAPPSAAETEAATVLGGLPDARYWADAEGEAMAREGARSVDRELAHLGLGTRIDRLPPATYLSLSGGSDDGAFGAGLLVGWTEAGTRPTFKIVTGVSTGALAAPFAFLGPAYDDALRDVYTAVTPRDVFRQRSWLAAALSDSVADTEPLFALISRHATPGMLAEIAREHRRGRLLLIGTTQLDSMRPVIWNIGAIAASGHPDALELVRRVLLASASVPVAFPPVMISVEVEGRHHQEMHVDGGAIAQLFLYPATATADPALRQRVLAHRSRTAYVIRNARLGPEWAAVNRRIIPVAARSIASMIHTSGNSDILRLQTLAARDGVDFNLAYIGRDFTVVRTGLFDQAYMNALFQHGHALARQGYPWAKSHPLVGLVDPVQPTTRPPALRR